MDDERTISQLQSRQGSRLSSRSIQYFDFLDTHHSVFSRNDYYHDLHALHPWIRRPCSRNSGIALSTLRSTSCSPRLDQLAKPKIKRERLIRQEFFDNFYNYSYSGVSNEALNAVCSKRLFRLAQPKPTPHGYLEAHKLPRSVSASALNVHPSERSVQLAKPRRNILHLQANWKKHQK